LKGYERRPDYPAPAKPVSAAARRAGAKVAAESVANPTPSAGVAKMLSNSIFAQLQKMMEPQVTGEVFFSTPKEAVDYIAAWGVEAYGGDFPENLSGLEQIPAEKRQAVLDFLTKEAADFTKQCEEEEARTKKPAPAKAATRVAEQPKTEAKAPAKKAASKTPAKPATVGKFSGSKKAATR
jgi:hypothetical protein